MNEILFLSNEYITGTFDLSAFLILHYKNDTYADR